MIQLIERGTPESVGISSLRILRMLQGFDELRMHTHSVLLSRGDTVVAEGYYRPFDEHTLHRMYSASKTFVAVAVGVAVTEGLFRMDDRIVDYFPEYTAEVDEQYRACTVRDMLKMKSNVTSCISWWGRFESRVRAYYTHPTEQIPDTLFYYDSIGCFLLGCIIERKTGLTFLEYLKSRVLDDIGFSRESYVLREPGGFTVGDSGVLCTTRDLWLFARLIMKRGCWGGKQYIDRAFMDELLSVQSYTHHLPGMTSWDGRGYGYLIWHTGEDCFTLTGLGDQLAVCDLKHDVLFVMTADNQGNKPARHILFHELNHHLLPSVETSALPEDEKGARALREYLEGRELIVQDGRTYTPLATRVSGVPYAACANPLDIREVTLSLGEGGGTLRLQRGDTVYTIPFGLCHNVFTELSLGPRARADRMGVYEEGAYHTAASGAWVDEQTFALLVQVIDTYFGALKVIISYKDDALCAHIVKSGQYVFEGWEGRCIARATKMTTKQVKTGDSI